MKSNLPLFLLCSLAAALAWLAPLPSAPAATNPTALWPGHQADGSMLLPNQWSLRPAGISVDLGDFPVNLAVHPDGRYAAVLHAGYGQHEVVVVDLAAGRIASRTNLTETFYGLAFSRDGCRLFCSGSSGEIIFAFDFTGGQLAHRARIKLRDVAEQGVPTGLAVDETGRMLYAANLWNSRVSRVDLESLAVRDLPLLPNHAALVPAGVPTAQDFDTSAATKRAKATEFTADPDCVYPYSCVLDSRRERLYVSLWGAAAVAVLDLKSEQVIARWITGEHPCEMALRRDGKFLFVANANDNTVTVLDTSTGQTLETLTATLFPAAPRGSTPNSLALSPDDKLLFIANANINAVAVFDIDKPGASHSLGFIPTGWYPTCVRVTPDGKHLLVTNGKGTVAMANPGGPQPARGQTKKGAKSEYIGGLFTGSLSLIDLPTGSRLIPQLATWTAQVLQCSPLRPGAVVGAPCPDGNPIPGRPGEPSPITHCLYIIKENRTYDQVFGDLPQGNGDPRLCLFPESVTPNLHKLVREFVLLDNFYVDAEVSADGHEWTMAAYATDFVEKTWPLNYGHKSSKFPYPSEGVFPIAYPASGYLWDRAAAAGVSYRSYGEFVQNPKATNRPVTTKVKALQGHFDPWFRSFDLDYSDLQRADRFIAEMHRFEREGDMPQLQIVRLPNDHTHGVSKGKITPSAYVAENDAALGNLVAAVSRSKFWPQTAIFVIEDDAQNGPDHVDAHRTEALVISPYTKHGVVDSTLYSTSSMLRTMELILGLQPMTQFDAAAAPMFNSFQNEPKLDPYTALPPNLDLHATNELAGWGSQWKLNYAREDAVDDKLFSEIIWRAVKADGRPMPAPVHAGFVLSRPARDDD